ncbi:uncharacterized protein LOC126900340 [Daktulosphaira vitifoliae]|uniref:uncharacterized protein LOC126900340 n=1 Tax=Daktulosphaira vitifoliae TaxID=58002 RepID=UPI0021AAEBE2|nr:uncharacterized protein LOC126900340 [Daktulosphaira vitifoliae]
MMEELKKKLQQQVRNTHKSIGELVINRKYIILNLTRMETQFGLSIKCQLSDTGTNVNSEGKSLSSKNEKKISGIFYVYLPKSVSMSEEEIANFNSTEDENMHLVYRGNTPKNKFLIDFI